MFRVLAGLASAAGVFAASAAEAGTPAPLAAFGELPTIEQIAISPDGKLLAIDLVKDDQRSVVVQDLSAKKMLTGIRVGQAKIRNLQFAGDDHLIITSSSTSGMLGVMVDSPGALAALPRKVPAILGQAGDVPFDIAGVRKDLLAMTAACHRAGVPTPAATGALSAYAGATAAGWGAKDFSTIIRFWAEAVAGV